MSKALSVSAFCKLWWADCEFEQIGPNSYHVWEPLNMDAPENARPYCYGLGEIDFYDSTGNRKLAHAVQCHHFNNAHGDLLLLGNPGIWVDVASGQVTYRKGSWYMRWLCFRNTRRAHFANHGFRIWNVAEQPRIWPQFQHWGGWHGWQHGSFWWRGREIYAW